MSLNSTDQPEWINECNLAMKTHADVQNEVEVANGCSGIERDLVHLESQKSLAYVFRHALRIPGYQRGYCWGEIQVKDLMESLWAADKNKPFHLGTVIIHCHPDCNGNPQWDVVDGQQRLITLALLIQVIQPPDRDVFPFLRDNQTTDADVQIRLGANFSTIKEWLASHPLNEAERENFLGWLLAADGVKERGVRIVIG